MSKPWDLDDEVFHEPDAEEMKIRRHKERNKKQKGMMKVVGENLAAYACVMIIILLVGMIWTDIGVFIDVTSFISDALLTVMLFILADVCMAQIGTRGGKYDDEYIKLHEEYLTLRDTVRGMGLALMDVFCDWQIDVEYEFYMRKQCKLLKIDYQDYSEKYSKMTLEELKGALRVDLAAKVFALNQVKPIELNCDILMTDGKVRGERGGVPEGGEAFVERHTIGVGHILTTAVFGIIAAVPVFTLTQDISVGRIIYTIFKLAMMCYRMYSGYNRSAKGYNTIEPKHLQAKIRYLHLYVEFLQKKIYLSLQEKYNIHSEVLKDYDEAPRQNTIDEDRAGRDQKRIGDYSTAI